MQNKKSGVQIFNKKQAAERKDGWVMGNNIFFRMHRISDIYFVGGFGTVQWVDVAEYAATSPDNIVLDNPHKTLQVALLLSSPTWAPQPPCLLSWSNKWERHLDPFERAIAIFLLCH